METDYEYVTREGVAHRFSPMVAMPGGFVMGVRQDGVVCFPHRDQVAEVQSSKFKAQGPVSEFAVEIRIAETRTAAGDGGTPPEADLEIGAPS